MDDYVVIDSQRKKRKSKKKKSSKKLIKADADEAAEVVDRIEDDDQGNFMLNHDFWSRRLIFRAEIHKALLP